MFNYLKFEIDIFYFKIQSFVHCQINGYMYAFIYIIHKTTQIIFSKISNLYLLNFQLSIIKFEYISFVFYIC